MSYRPAVLHFLLYRWPSLAILSLHQRPGQEEEAWEDVAVASLTFVDLVEAFIGLPEWAGHLNRW